MKITYIKELTESQRESLSSIPEDIIKRLKKLTIEQQMECIYSYKSDYSGIKVMVDYEPTEYARYKKCFSLSRVGIEEIFVYDDVIVEVIDGKGRDIKFGSAFFEKVIETHEEWDAHDHSVYTASTYVEYRVYLIIFKNHKYLTNNAEENNA